MNDNIIWHNMIITKSDRENLLKQKAYFILLTGLSGSGKSTIASNLERILLKENKLTYILDGDNIRHGISAGLGFDNEDRKENLRRVNEIGKLMVDAGIIIIASFIAPTNLSREIFRNTFNDRYIEVHVRCPIDICEDRDPKGLYKKARKGEIVKFTGVDDEYEVPENPHIVVDTGGFKVEESVDMLYRFLSPLIEG